MSDQEAMIICRALGFSWESLGEKDGDGQPSRESFRKAVAALDRHRAETQEKGKAHMLSELSDLAHLGGGD
ncbi:hypothetical protein [Microvirga pudoricolor]|uniref:hypothetical protein n=1 Tax=Microvirga pudoricolor TaxID=2778729 RepID=UPI00194FC985|nr:hypothetical protein [Microvirga pudoricolor]MBM6593621.1 hypothetical protein [Microvirga pudoricolor]